MMETLDTLFFLHQRAIWFSISAFCFAMAVLRFVQFYRRFRGSHASASR